MAGNNRQPGRSVTSKALAILDAFTPGQPELTLAQIARRTELPVPTVHRLSRELVDWGGLERTDDGLYRIGLRLWEVATLAPRPNSLRQTALPYMQDLYEVTHENVQLDILSDHQTLCVEKISGRNAVPVQSKVGSRLPLHATSAGKVLLAHSPAAFVEGVLSRGLARLTPRTIVMPGKLLQSLAEVRRTGLAYCYEELTLGSVAVAAPIHGPHEEVVAAVSVAVRSFPIDTQRLAPAVRGAGMAISRALARTGHDLTGPRRVPARR